MADTIAPTKTVTFTIKKVPDREAQRKTIRRLMRMQPDVQRGLQKLAHRRKLKDNITYIRAGVEWTNRKRTTKLTRVAVGETFTLRITPQILKDIASVEQFLDADAI